MGFFLALIVYVAKTVEKLILLCIIVLHYFGEIQKLSSYGDDFEILDQRIPRRAKDYALYSIVAKDKNI